MASAFGTMLHKIALFNSKGGRTQDVKNDFKEKILLSEKNF